MTKVSDVQQNNIVLVHKHVKSYILNRKVHYENKYLEWQRQWYKDSLYVSELKRNRDRMHPNPTHFPIYT